MHCICVRRCAAIHVWSTTDRLFALSDKAGSKQYHVAGWVESSVGHSIRNCDYLCVCVYSVNFKLLQGIHDTTLFTTMQWFHVRHEVCVTGRVRPNDASTVRLYVQGVKIFYLFMCMFKKTHLRLPDVKTHTVMT